ncbi:2-alkenal reductase (NADP(+)-dependent) [Sesamum alatum]|uniref:2-alkenal reductase (NADP(+)-dependent) n=1 Tax=Sesamum alatum TaxID=300844 RepID=A0AAE2CFN3_9LAMI|nr:2-alkenal reductase (NADP(+)-dependent) [Sesamum alatum]
MEKENSSQMLPNKQIVLKNHIQGCPKESDFELKTTSVSTEISDGCSDNAVLLKNLYLACDPYLCHLMRADRHSLLTSSSLVPGSVVKGQGVAKVMKSGYGELKEGDYVWGVTGWEEFTWNFDPQNLLTKIQNYQHVPLSYYAGILGMPGLTAYAGFHEICCPKKGEAVYVSSAAGGVGHLVGQFAKMMGCYVVGSTSTQQKVHLLKTKLGFDNAFNYREVDLRSELNKYFPRGIDACFENVGGQTLDEVLLQMKTHGRIAVSGMISQYNVNEPHGVKNLFSLIERRLTLRGFVELDYKSMYRSYVEWALEKLQEKKLVYVEDVVPGLENAASAFVGIFHGHNVGKRVVVVAED